MAVTTDAAPPAHDASAGIVTPEAVLLEFADAGVGSRSVAALVDLLGKSAILLAGITVAGAVAIANEVVAIIAVLALFFTAIFVYPAVFETFWGGRTPGKAVMGLRVVTLEGSPCRFKHAAIRSALGTVDFLLLFGAPAILSALCTRRGQRLGDLAAGTMVIRSRQAQRVDRSATFVPWWGWEPWAAALDVGRLRADQYAVARAFLLRAHEFRPEARWETASALAAELARTVDVELRPDLHPEGVVVAIAAAYQLRHGGPVVEAPPSFVAGGAAGEPPPLGDGVAPPLAPGWGLAPVRWQ